MINLDFVIASNGLNTNISKVLNKEQSFFLWTGDHSVVLTEVCISNNKNYETLYSIIIFYIYFERRVS